VEGEKRIVILRGAPVESHVESPYQVLPNKEESSSCRQGNTSEKVLSALFRKFRGGAGEEREIRERLDR